MKILKFKGKMSFKNKFLITISIITVVLFTTVYLIYSLNEEAREWINLYVLRKEITEDNIATINLEAGKNQYIQAYDRYISILQNGKITIYNGYANKEIEFDIKISNPIYDTNLDYLAIAEKNGERICLISNTRILWEGKVEGAISKINVSKNGEVSVITTGTSYKSIITTFDKNGKELFKTYLASTIAIDVDVSTDGNYLAVAEVKTSSAVIESRIKIVDMKKAINGERREFCCV